MVAPALLSKTSLRLHTILTCRSRKYLFHYQYKVGLLFISVLTCLVRNNIIKNLSQL